MVDIFFLGKPKQIFNCLSKFECAIKSFTVDNKNELNSRREIMASQKITSSAKVNTNVFIKFNLCLIIIDSFNLIKSIFKFNCFIIYIELGFWKAVRLWGLVVSEPAPLIAFAIQTGRLNLLHELLIIERRSMSFVYTNSI